MHYRQTQHGDERVDKTMDMKQLEHDAAKLGLTVESRMSNYHITSTSCGNLIKLMAAQGCDLRNDSVGVSRCWTAHFDGEYVGQILASENVPNFAFFTSAYP